MKKDRLKFSNRFVRSAFDLHCQLRCANDYSTEYHEMQSNIRSCQIFH